MKGHLTPIDMICKYIRHETDMASSVTAACGYGPSAISLVNYWTKH